jgi:hypothetical protein
MLVLCPTCGNPVIEYNPHCKKHFAPQPQRAIVKGTGAETRRQEAEKRKALLRDRPSLEVLTQAVATISEIPEGELRGGKKHMYRALAFARRLLIYMAVLDFKYKRTVVATYLDLSEASITHGVSAVRIALAENAEVRDIRKKVIDHMGVATLLTYSAQNPDA